MKDRADQLASESAVVNCQLTTTNQVSSLALQLYSWYIQNGHARNEGDVKELKLFFEKSLPDTSKANGFYEKLYLYQCWCWYAFIRIDFLLYYRYCQKWVDLFEKNPEMLGGGNSELYKRNA